MGDTQTVDAPSDALTTLAGLKARAAELRDTIKAESRRLTADEAAEVEQLDAGIKSAQAEVELIERATAKVAELVEAKSAKDAKGLRQRTGDLGLGGMLVESDAYKAFKADTSRDSTAPIHIATGKAAELVGTKANVTIGTNAPKERLPMVDLTTTDILGLLDVITTGSADGPFDYMRLLTNSQAAAVQNGEGTLKAKSDFTYDLASAKSITFADGYTVSTQMLEDAGAVKAVLDTALADNLKDYIEDELINGDGTNGTPVGILNTSGTIGVAFDTSMVKTLRKAITALGKTRINAVLINPADDEALDLLQDGNQRYYGQGPFGQGPTTIWGRRRVLSDKVPEGTAIMGDLSTVTLLDHKGLSVTAFNQHEDYAQRNLVYVRAELRAVPAIFIPGRLAVVDLTA